MADDVSFAQEIDEELRAERAYRFWMRHGRLLVTLAVLIVLASAASVIWKNHLRDLHERQTGNLSAGAQSAGNGKWEEAIGFYAPVEAAGGAFATLAALRHAQALLHLKQPGQALALYRDAAAGKFGQAPASLRDFAGLEAGILAGNQQKGMKTAGFPPEDGVYAQSVKEVRAMNLLAEGDGKMAERLLNSIVEDDTASLGARTRAAQLKESLPGTAR